MKFHQYIFLTAFLMGPLVKGQTVPSNENYVLQSDYQIALNREAVDTLPNNANSNDKKIENIVYYDGLGRPMQKVALRAGGNRQDLVIPIIYDDFGRQPLDYLPLPSTGNQGAFGENGNAQTGVVSDLMDYYETKFPLDLAGRGSVPAISINPYSQKHFENSPLNRVLEQAAPGNDWRYLPSENGHTVKFEFDTNASNEVRNFYITYATSSNNPILNLASNNYGNYPSGELFKTVTKDENWIPANGKIGITIEFKNKQGQVVLKRVIGSKPNPFPSGNPLPKNHDTYYVYDDFGNLVFVLSPEGSDKIIANNKLLTDQNQLQKILDDFCYKYKYDHRDRLVWKKIPGKKFEAILYDRLNRPVLTQDAYLRDKRQYHFTKYDAFGRVAYTGIYTTTMIVSEMETHLLLPAPHISETQSSVPLDINGTAVYYSNDVFPYDNLEVLTINYYDKYVSGYYNVSNGLTLPSKILDQYRMVNVKGLPTVSKVRTLDTPMWTTSLVAYDTKGRVIYTDSYNEYLNNRDKVLMELDFVGNPIETVTSHTKEGATTTIRDYFGYDHMRRLLSHKQQIDSAPTQLIAENNYDPLGQLVQKKVGGETTVDGYTDLENIDVTFNGIVTPTTTAPNWPSRLKTKGKIIEDGGISFKVEGVNKQTRVGLIKPANGNAGNSYLDYGFYLRYINNAYKVYIVRNGTNQVTNRTYSPGDTFKVAREGTVIKYYHNSNTPFTTTNYVGNGEALIGKAAFSGPGGGISTLSLYGPKIDKVLQHVGHSYNIRGWLTDINKVDQGLILPEGVPLFSFRINYNRVEGNATATPLFNGNIAQTLWKTVNDDKNIRGYGYSYDRLNRITGADSYRGTKLETMTSTTEHDVQEISYDLNGNIQTLTRWGADEEIVPTFGQWDALTYTYKGNQLEKVVDGSTSTTHRIFGFKDGSNSEFEYLYDDNGNMTKDMNKGISAITYNHLNLPVLVTMPQNNNTTRTIAYVYDATGVRLQKIVTPMVGGVSNPTVTEYANGFIYNNAGSGAMKLQFIAHPEGYVEPVTEIANKVKGFDLGTGEGTLSSYKYVFQFRDHLNNVRLSYSDLNLDGVIDPLNEIIEESNYYPFGLKQKGYNMDISPDGNALAQQWKFGGKEFNQELGLDWYDISARNYDPALGRWMNIDPLAEMMRRHSPYNYAFDNPIFWIDPDGREPMVNMGYTEQSLSSITGSVEFSSTFDTAGTGESSNNSEAYKSYFQQVQKDVAKADVSLDGGDKNGDDCCGGKKGISPTDFGPPPVADFGSLDRGGANNRNANPAPSKVGGFVGVSNQFALAGGFSFSLGLVWDNNGGWAIYYGAGATIGLASSIGIEGGSISATTSSGFNVGDFEGTSAGYDFSLGSFGYSHGGTINTQLHAVQRMNYNNFGNTENGYKTNSGSLSKGGFFKGRLGGAAMWSQNHTSILRIR